MKNKSFFFFFVCTLALCLSIYMHVQYWYKIFLYIKKKKTNECTDMGKEKTTQKQICVVLQFYQRLQTQKALDPSALCVYCTPPHTLHTQSLGYGGQLSRGVMLSQLTLWKPRVDKLSDPLPSSEVKSQNAGRPWSVAIGDFEDEKKVDVSIKWRHAVSWEVDSSLRT